MFSRHSWRPALVILTVFISLNAASYFPPTAVADTTWERISPASLGWNTDRIDSLLSYLETNNSRAFIVIKGGKIAIERYFGNFTKDSLWYWASAGKSLTAFIVGIAQQEGYLSIHDKTSRWLGQGWTDCPLAKEDLITVRHQLTMTTGLDDGVADPYCTADTCLICVADASTRWAYHNAPYTLLDKVIEAATAKTMNGFVAAALRAKTGIVGAFLKSGYNNVFYSTPRAMARFGLLMVNRGVWGSDTILRDTSFFRQMITSSQESNKSYGYLWWLNGKSSYMVPQSQVVIPGMMCPPAPADMVAAMGKNGQFINVVPSLDLVVVRMGDAPENTMVPFLLNNGIWERLMPVIKDGTSAHRPIQAGEVHRAYREGGNEVFDLQGRRVRLGLRSAPVERLLVTRDSRSRVRVVLDYHHE